MTQTIKCTNCGHEFALNEAFLEEFEQEKQRAINKAVAHANQEAEKTREALEEDFQQRQETLKNELAETRAALEKKLRLEIQESVEEDYELKLQEKDEELRRLAKELRALERRTKQGSMELQGEALETLLKDELELLFPLDTVSDVKKGHSGADLTHEVFNRADQRCGTIVWEAKNTKNWNDEWLSKIKEDAARENAHIKVIVSVALPDGVDTFDLIDGVWVSTVQAAPALAKVLRTGIIQTARIQRSMEGWDSKMGQVYSYLTSPTFRDRIQRMVETWEALKKQVDKEERAMQKQWKERRKRLDMMIDVTTDLYSDFSAIMGTQMPEVEGLELPQLAEGGAD